MDDSILRAVVSSCTIGLFLKNLFSIQFTLEENRTYSYILTHQTFHFLRLHPLPLPWIHRVKISIHSPQFKSDSSAFSLIIYWWFVIETINRCNIKEHIFTLFWRWSWRWRIEFFLWTVVLVPSPISRSFTCFDACCQIYSDCERKNWGARNRSF